MLVTRTAILLLSVTTTFAFAASDAPEPAANVKIEASSGAETLDQVKALIDSEKYSAALALIESHKESNTSPDLLNLKGFSLRKLGKANEAVVVYNSALKLKPNFPQAKEYLAVAYLQLKNVKEAQALYSDLTKSAPEYAKMLKMEAEKLKIKLK
jgi:Flp pilus assembly protein TadD